MITYKVNRPNDSTNGCNCTVTIMPKHCAEFSNKPQSITMQRNLRHIGGT